jgi:uracil-DNA glycosylase
VTERWIESGDPRSPVWVVGEAPGEWEVEAGRPLVGASGQEFDRWLREAGWPADTPLFRTNICHERPPSYYDPKQGKTIHNDIGQFFASAREAKAEGLQPLSGRYPRAPITAGLDRLRQLLTQHRPTLIIALGGSALWALAGHEGITKWRGSVLEAGTDFGACKVIPTLHPAVVLVYQYNYRIVCTQDMRRALRESAFPEIRRPQWQFVVAPTLSDVKDWLTPIIEKAAPLVCDTEGWGVVDCIGFADSPSSAICIPFIKSGAAVQESAATGANYWCPDDEAAVFDLCVRALRSCPQTFHNALWDCQVIARRWGIVPRLSDDTMVMQHTLFPGLLGGKIDPVTGRVDKKGSSLSLAFVASMYCDYYRYWKDDGRVRDSDYDDLTYWRYNCEDCVRTFEVRDSLAASLRAANLTAQYQELMALFGPVLTMMFRGLRKDSRALAQVQAYINSALHSEQQWLNEALGYQFNVESNPLAHALFYDDLGCQVIKHRSTGRPTLHDAALDLIAKRQPLLLPLVRRIQNLRSLNTNNDTFMDAFSRANGRLRTALSITGTETFRFSSSETAFGEGTNLQNLTRSVEE